MNELIKNSERNELEQQVYVLRTRISVSFFFRLNDILHLFCVTALLLLMFLFCIYYCFFVMALDTSITNTVIENASRNAQRRIFR